MRSYIPAVEGERLDPSSRIVYFLSSFLVFFVFMIASVTITPGASRNQRVDGNPFDQLHSSWPINEDSPGGRAASMLLRMPISFFSPLKQASRGNRGVKTTILLDDDPASAVVLTCIAAGRLSDWFLLEWKSSYGPRCLTCLVNHNDRALARAAEAYLVAGDHPPFKLIFPVFDSVATHSLISPAGAVRFPNSHTELKAGRLVFLDDTAELLVERILDRLPAELPNSQTRCSSCHFHRDRKWDAVQVRDNQIVIDFGSVPQTISLREALYHNKHHFSDSPSVVRCISSDDPRSQFGVNTQSGNDTGMLKQQNISLTVTTEELDLFKVTGTGEVGFLIVRPLAFEE